MTPLVPLAVAVPLLGAAAFAAAGQLLRGRVFNALAIPVAAATTGICLVLLLRSWHGDLVYWFAGWQVRHGVALGIEFTVTPLGAAFATLAGFLATCAITYTWSSFRGREVGNLFYTLMLLFTAGMIGFSLTGDLFNLFVFFELMSVSAYALTGFRIREAATLEGSLQFAATNSVGAFLILFGIALVYGRTAALNLAQIGVELASRPPDALVGVALALIVAGFLIKAGAFPFHFWLADAYAVAPVAVGALLTGLMSELGYHAIARVYWTAFSGAADRVAVRSVLLALGVASVVVGGVMAFLQSDLKRMIAFATVSMGGISLVGTALLNGEGLAGAAVMVVGGGLTRAAAILLIGICIEHCGSGDELDLRGRGRELPAVGIGLALCALALAGTPPFGPFLGKALIEQAAVAAGHPWLPAVLTLSTVLVGGALARAAARVFLGWGPARDPLLARQQYTDREDEEPDDEDEDDATGADGAEERREHPPRLPMLLPAFALLVVALGIGLVPTLAGRALASGDQATDRASYAAEVLHGQEPAAPVGALPEPHLTAARYAYGSGSAVAALGIAALVLERRRLPRAARAAARAARPAVQVLHTVHSGALGDYITWLAAGVAVLTAVWAVTFT